MKFANRVRSYRDHNHTRSHQPPNYPLLYFGSWPLIRSPSVRIPWGDVHLYSSFWINDLDSQRILVDIPARNHFREPVAAMRFSWEHLLTQSSAIFIAVRRFSQWSEAGLVALTIFTHENSTFTQIYFITSLRKHTARWVPVNEPWRPPVLDIIFTLVFACPLMPICDIIPSGYGWG